MEKAVFSSKELFEKIIRVWGGRPDPSEKLNVKQIAALVLRSGTDENASIIGRTIVYFSDYFKSEGPYQWCVRWTKIQQEHPGLYPGSEVAATQLAYSQDEALTEMMQALHDEVEAVKKQASLNPINAMIR